MQISFFKNKNNFKKGNLKIRPDFYWHIILSFGILLILLSAVFGFYLFEQTERESNLSINSSNELIPTVKKERIDKVLEFFTLREQKSKEIINSPSSVVDPSL